MEKKLTIVAGLIFIVAIIAVAIITLRKNDTADTGVEPTNETETAQESAEAPQEDAEEPQNEAGKASDYSAIKVGLGYKFTIAQIELTCATAAQDFDGLEYSEITSIVGQDPNTDQELANWFNEQTGTFQKNDFFQFMSEYASNAIIKLLKGEGIYSGNAEEDEALKVAIKSDVYDVCSGARTAEEIRQANEK